MIQITSLTMRHQRSGHSLVPGGPSKPTTDGFSEEEAAQMQMIKDWRLAQKNTLMD